MQFWLCMFAAGFSQLTLADHHDGQLSLEQLTVANHRAATNIARNQFRHPVETLEFFGLKPEMTVIEILPSTGWYTEIIAPYVRDHGKYYAAHFSPNATASYMAPNLRNFEAKITAEPELYGKITVRHLNPPHEVVIAPPESADMALTFRNVHNWIMADLENEFFATFYAALKPGGILGIVEHRAKGVWTLPPNYRMGDTDRARYAAIGESDRMTLNKNVRVPGFQAEFVGDNNSQTPTYLLPTIPVQDVLSRSLCPRRQG